MTTKTIASVGLALILAALAVTGAEARTRRHVDSVQMFDRHSVNGWVTASVETPRVKIAPKVHVHRPYVPKPTGYPERRVVEQIVSHPPGCPRVKFCGCGTSLYLLGKAVAKGGLAIARNWLDFPRSSCAPHMAAARPGHVFAIIECLDGNRALAYDANSGGHRTRIHIRSLAGYTVVNPNGHSRYAAARVVL